MKKIWKRNDQKTEFLRLQSSKQPNTYNPKNNAKVNTKVGPRPRKSENLGDFFKGAESAKELF